MVYNGYYKVMSNIPKMGQLPTPVGGWLTPLKNDGLRQFGWFSIPNMMGKKEKIMFQTTNKLYKS